jgi:hypothetical protein
MHDLESDGRLTLIITDLYFHLNFLCVNRIFASNCILMRTKLIHQQLKLVRMRKRKKKLEKEKNDDERFLPSVK